MQYFELEYLTLLVLRPDLVSESTAQICIVEGKTLNRSVQMKMIKLTSAL